MRLRPFEAASRGRGGRWVSRPATISACEGKKGLAGEEGLHCAFEARCRPNPADAVVDGEPVGAQRLRASANTNGKHAGTRASTGLEGPSMP
jgi:hypothetical protein